MTSTRRLLLCTLAALLGGAARAGESLDVEASLPTLLLGRDEASQLRIRGPAEALRDVRVGCSSGAVRAVQRVEPTEVRAEFVPQASAEPSWVLCAAASPSTGAFGTVVLELNRRDVISLSGLPPLARVEMGIGSATFGPVRANGAGLADVPVVLTPASRQAEIRATPPGQPEQVRPYALAMSPQDQVVLLTVPEAVADGTTAVPLFGFVLGGRGARQDLPVAWSSPDGQVRLRRVGVGAWAGTFTPHGRAVRSEGALFGDPEHGKPGSGRLVLRPGVRTTISLSSSVRGLPADGLATTELMLWVTDETGRGLTGQPISLEASAGTLSGAEERSGGQYVARYTAPFGSPGQAEVVARVPGAPPAKLLLALTMPPRVTIEATPREVRADGHSKVMLSITVRDPDGRPLPDGTAVLLSSSLGTVPSSLEISGGRATAELVAGTRAGIAHIEARARDVTASTQLRLLSGPPARIDVVPERPAITCDGKDTLQLQIAVRDAFGNGIDSPSLELSEQAEDPAAPAAPGQFERVATLGQGAFGVRYHAPARCDRKSVAIVASSGGLAGSARLALVRGFSTAFAMSARFGAAHDLGRSGAASFELEADVPVSSRLRAATALELRLSPASAGSATRLGAAPIPFTSSTSMASLRIGPSVRLYEDERFLLYAGAGADAHLVRVTYAFTVSSGLPGRQAGFAAGAHVRIGAGYALGPGLLTAQLRLSVAPFEWGDSGARGRANGAGLAAGYRLSF